MAKNNKNAEKFQRQLLELLKEDCNKVCADCHARGPRWASWNLGVFVCIRCSGIHRSLGVHISKVKSVNLDTWTQEQVDNMLAWGNGVANEYYEYKIPSDFKRPMTDQAAEKFIRNKYEKRLYVHDVEYSGSVKSSSAGTANAKTTTTTEVKPAAVNAPVRNIPVVPLKTKSEGYTPPAVPQRKPVAVSSQPSLLQVSLETNTAAKTKSVSTPSNVTRTTNNELVDIFGDMVGAPSTSNTNSSSSNNALLSNTSTPQNNSVNLLSDVKVDPPTPARKDIKSSIMSLYGNTNFSNPQPNSMFNGGHMMPSGAMNSMQQGPFNIMPHGGANGFNTMSQMPQGSMNQIPQRGINQMPQGGVNQMPGHGMSHVPQAGMNQMPQGIMNPMTQGRVSTMSMNGFQGMPQNNRVPQQQYNMMMSQHQQQGMAQHQQPGMMQHQQPGMQYMMNPSVYSMNPQQQQQMMMSNQLILNKLQQQNNSQFGSQQETRAEPNKQQFNNIPPQQQGFGGQPFGGSVQGMQNFGRFQQQNQQNQLNSVQRQLQQIKIGQQSTPWGFTS